MTPEQLSNFTRAYQHNTGRTVKGAFSNSSSTGCVRRYTCLGCREVIVTDSAKCRPTKTAQATVEAHLDACPKVAELVAQGEALPSAAALAATGTCIRNESAGFGVEYRVCYKLPDGKFLSGTRRKDTGGDQGQIFDEKITSSKPRWA